MHSLQSACSLCSGAVDLIYARPSEVSFANFQEIVIMRVAFAFALHNTYVGCFR